MFAQHSAYILGIVNLFLAIIAMVCVIQAEEHPEYFPLVYVAVGIFIFYMGTILIIIILQIFETYREKHHLDEQHDQIPLDIQIPIITAQIVSQLNTIIEENLVNPTKTITMKPKLSRSQTLPVTLSSYTSHPTVSISTSSSTLKNSNELNVTSSQMTLLPKHQAAVTTLRKNYQSFAFRTHDHQCLS